jgi:hypothetical protein
MRGTMGTASLEGEAERDDDGVDGAGAEEEEDAELGALLLLSTVQFRARCRQPPHLEHRIGSRHSAARCPRSR